MARTLRYSGLFVLAVTAWVMIAGHFAWITEEFADRTSDRLLPLGVILLVAGLLVPVLAPVLRTLAGTRCVRCRVRIERGQAYCHDHLQETVNEYRDTLHNG